MAEVTSTTNVIGTALGAVVGGTLLVAAAPILLPVAVFGGVAAAVTVGVGTVLGAAAGYFSTKPSPQQIQQLVGRR